MWRFLKLNPFFVTRVEVKHAKVDGNIAGAGLCEEKVDYDTC